MCLKEAMEALRCAAEAACEHLVDLFSSIADEYERCVDKESTDKPKWHVDCSCIVCAALRLDLLPYYASGFL